MSKASRMLNKDIYEDIFEVLWELSMGQSGGWRTQYKGASRFGLFLIKEIEYINSLEEIGETALERRGLVAPKKLMAAWAFNILEECNSFRIPPPWPLIQAIYALMGCSHLHVQRKKLDEKYQFEDLQRNANISLRAASRKVGVNPTTAMGWRDEGKEREEKWAIEHKAIRERMGLIDFLPIGSRKWSRQKN
jgi:hypothetical protein